MKRFPAGQPTNERCPRAASPENSRESESTAKYIGKMAVGALAGASAILAAGNMYTAYRAYTPSPEPDLSKNVLAALEVHDIAMDGATITCREMPSDRDNGLTQSGGVYTYKIPGVWQHPTTVVHMNTRHCQEALAGLDAIDSAQPLEPSQVDALVTVFHEREHTRGVIDEATAECTALQKFGGWLESKDNSSMQTLAEPMRSTHNERLSAEYMSLECRPGGALDITGKSDEPTSTAFLPRG
ncbi:hypothetical protein CR983_03560 [Candidatus Saccharibacteria bacterium]|nr:MAG: hypothetical protein CR983_03560 [Candidatus Saccharibacteria bacterium]